jgi:hypothetical protein
VISGSVISDQRFSLQLLTQSDDLYLANLTCEISVIPISEVRTSNAGQRVKSGKPYLTGSPRVCSYL